MSARPGEGAPAGANTAKPDSVRPRKPRNRVAADRAPPDRLASGNGQRTGASSSMADQDARVSGGRFTPSRACPTPTSGTNQPRAERPSTRRSPARRRRASCYRAPGHHHGPARQRQVHPRAALARCIARACFASTLPTTDRDVGLRHRTRAVPRSVRGCIRRTGCERSAPRRPRAGWSRSLLLRRETPGSASRS